MTYICITKFKYFNNQQTNMATFRKVKPGAPAPFIDQPPVRIPEPRMVTPGTLKQYQEQFIRKHNQAIHASPLKPEDLGLQFQGADITFRGELVNNWNHLFTLEGEEEQNTWVISYIDEESSKKKYFFANRIDVQYFIRHGRRIHS